MSHMTILDESNGNTLSLKSSPLAPSTSTEDLSEYTDADESISAPTEYFAEFLSAIMTHDYRRALKYCKLILEFEPNNLTAKEFYPLILEKISYEQQQESETDENSNVEDFEVANSRSDSNFSDATDASSSDDADFPSSNGSNDYGDEGRDEDIEIGPSSSSYSDSTTHSYSSLLLEDEDDLIPPLPKKDSLDICNGNGSIFRILFSDSESPTEPLTQRLAGIFKSSLNT